MPQNQQVEIQHVSEQNIEDYLKFINTLLNRLVNHMPLQVHNI